MKKNDFSVFDFFYFAFIILVVLGFGFYLGFRTTGFFALEESEPLVLKEGPVWVNTEHLAVPREEVQDGVLVITDLNEGGYID